MANLQCPNGCGLTLEVKSDGSKECPTCHYSMSAVKPREGNKHTQAVNQAIKEMLVESRLTGEPVPWKREHIIIDRRNYDSNRKYTGINRWLLAMDSDICYITADSIEKHGLVKADDAKPRYVVAWIPPRLTAADKTLPLDEQKKVLAKKRPFMVVNQVYRSKDTPGLPEKKFDTDKNNRRYDNVEEFIASIPGLTFEVGGNQPHYKKFADVVVVPRIEQYESSEAYYRDVLHEVAHWTGHQARLNRDEKKYQSGQEYGREELIAEMASAYLCHYFGIPVSENTVSYIDGWLLAIKADTNMLVSAGQQAEKVLDYFKLNEGESKAKAVA